MTDLFRTIHGSAHDIPLPDRSVQCIVTSPPYWSLRKYSGSQSIEWPAVTFRLNEWTEPVTVDAMTCDLGLEPDPVAYIGHLILCLREWRRVLRDDGVCFVNLGDSYNGSGGAGGDYAKGGLREGQPKYGRKDAGGLKAKDLCGIPWMFAMAARADGWWLRSDIVWAKPNPMPESVTDRPTSAHEHVFLLAKSARYYYDADAVREAASDASIARISQSTFDTQTGGPKDYSNGTNPNRSMRQTLENFAQNPGRNLRNVWTIPTQPTPYAHFATYPEKLVEPCIRAGTSARGCCPECGAPWERVVEKEVNTTGDGRAHIAGGDRTIGQGWEGTPRATLQITTTGWRPTCECFGHLERWPIEYEDDYDGHPQRYEERYIWDRDEPETVPCTVLDPFHGSGTTGVVALREGRAYVGMDISREYLDSVTSERIAGGMQIGLGL